MELRNINMEREKMKKMNVDTFYVNLCQNAYEELSVIESIISSVQESCLNLELNSQYYDIDNFVLKISEERNRYINLLSIAREKIKNIEILNTQLEEKLT